MADVLTEEQFKMVLPPALKKNVNPDLMDHINNTLSDPEHLEAFKDNLIGFTNILQMGRFKIFNYVNAVKYVSLKLTDMTNKDAYIKTFPDKYTEFVAKGLKQNVVASYISSYHKSKLVMLLFEQTLIPSYITNAPVLQEAINVQADLMMHAKSELVRSNAAACLIKELKPPEKTQVELDIGPVQDTVIDNYKTILTKMVRVQQDMIKSGGNVKAIANASVRLDPKEVIDI